MPAYIHIGLRARAPNQNWVSQNWVSQIETGFLANWVSRKLGFSPNGNSNMGYVDTSNKKCPGRVSRNGHTRIESGINDTNNQGRKEGQNEEEFPNGTKDIDLAQQTTEWNPTLQRIGRTPVEMKETLGKFQ